MPQLAVIGAGISGVTAAYALRQRGYNVHLIDRHPLPASETSRANGGQLSASNAEVWNQFSTVVKGLRWLFQRDAPLCLHLAPSWHKLSWMAEFLANMRHHERNTIATTRLAIAAREHLFRMAQDENIDFDLKQRGILHFYHDQASLDVAAKGNALLVAGGLERYPVSPDEIRQIEPTLPAEQFVGGYYTPSDASGDVCKFTRGLAQACARRGVSLHFDTLIERLVPEANGWRIHARHLQPGGDANQGEPLDLAVDGVVICAGVHSREFAKQLGDRVNIYPVKGYSITVHLDDAASQAAAPTVSLLDEAAKIVASRLGPDRFRVAGTAELNGFNRDIRADRVAPLERWTRRLLPSITSGHIEPWAGLRPMTPDMMPKVGAGRRPGVFYHTGHGHLGWTLSAATAEILAGAVDAQFASAGRLHPVPAH